MNARSPTTSIALAVALFIFFSSVWHLKAWNSVDISFTDDASIISSPDYVEPAAPAKPHSQPAVAPVAADDSSVAPETGEKEKLKPKPKKPLTKPATPVKQPTFYEVAKKHGTDKVTTHSYHKMYQKYIGPIRHQKLKMLEIGLGCDMNYGPGKSYYTWLEWLPNVDLYYMEYDAACAKKWADSTSGATVVAGDQADIPFLESFMEQYGKDFDIIIDDGGHTMKQQKTSIDTLYQAIKPGGVYFCEDLQTSYMPSYGGAHKDENTMVEYIKTMIDDMHMRGRSGHPDEKDIMSIDCMNEVCAFSKPISDMEE